MRNVWLRAANIMSLLQTVCKNELASHLWAIRFHVLPGWLLLMPPACNLASFIKMCHNWAGIAPGPHSGGGGSGFCFDIDDSSHERISDGCWATLPVPHWGIGGKCSTIELYPQPLLLWSHYLARYSRLALNLWLCFLGFPSAGFASLCQHAWLL